MKWVEYLYKENDTLCKDVQDICDKQKQVIDELAIIRVSLGCEDGHMYNKLQFYENILSPSELALLINERRFKDYHELADTVIAESKLLTEEVRG